MPEDVKKDAEKVAEAAPAAVKAEVAKVEVAAAGVSAKVAATVHGFVAEVSSVKKYALPVVALLAIAAAVVRAFKLI